MFRRIAHGQDRSAFGAATLLALAAFGAGGNEAVAQPAAAGGHQSSAELTGTPVPASNGAAVGSIQLITTTTGGTAATTSSSTCAVSADGSLVLFSSDASNLVAGDNNGTSDLFLKNLRNGTLMRVTTQSNGAQIAGGGNCLGTTMTPDGRVVAFNSGTTAFAKNTQTGVLTQASPPAGTLPQVTGFFGGVVSDDGSKLVFMTLPQTIYLGAYNWVNVIPARLMLRNLDTGSLETLATDNGIVAQGEIIGTRFAISPDGSRVAFVSSSASLVPGDINGRPDVFVRSLVDGSTLLASSTSSGAASNVSQYWRPTFVSNTQLAFGTSGSSNLGAAGLYLKNLGSGELSLVLSDSNGGASAVLSGDARKVVFQRNYSGFDARIFMRDRQTGVETLVSASAGGTPSNGTATGGVVSRDGTLVAFGSNARNLVSPRPPASVFQIYAKVTGQAPSVAAGR
jgi:Tol biopolymer transport system component